MISIFRLWVNLSISSTSMVSNRIAGCRTPGFRMHNAKPPTVPINENTTNGLTAEMRVSDPMNDAVSKQVRPQTVHESNNVFRYAGATNSAVLDRSSTSVIDVISLIVSAVETTSNEFVLSATEIVKFVKIDLSLENHFASSQIRLTFFEKCWKKEHHQSAGHIQQTSPQPLSFGIQNEWQSKGCANQFSTSCGWDIEMH